LCADNKLNKVKGKWTARVGEMYKGTMLAYNDLSNTWRACLSINE
jgi:hypothetical protein